MEDHSPAPELKPTRSRAPKVVAILFGALLVACLAIYGFASRPAGSEADRALLAAAKKNDFPALQEALRAGANVNARHAPRLIDRWTAEQEDFEEGYTALHYAVQHGNLPMTQLLIEKGANIDAQNIAGNTPLMLAASHLHPDVVRFLLSKKPNLALRNRWGSSPRDFAKKRNVTQRSHEVETIVARAMGEREPRPFRIPRN